MNAPPKLKLVSPPSYTLDDVRQRLYQIAIEGEENHAVAAARVLFNEAAANRDDDAPLDNDKLEELYSAMRS